MRCGDQGCDRVRSAPIHVFGHPEYHEFNDTRPVGLSPVGRRAQRFQRSSEGRAYKQTKREARGTPCQIVSPVCTGYVEHLHEPLPRGRAGGIEAALRDGPDPIPCCDACNGYVSDHPVWARERGLLLRRSDVA